MENRYQNINVIKQSGIGNQYYANNLYPEIEPTEEDDYVIAVLGDRLDLLAFDFYGDSSLWWIIASANSLPGDSLYLEPGTQIRIPVDVVSAVNQYKQANILQ